MKDLLKLKKDMKKRMPNFLRADFHKKKKLRSARWRRPKGITAKIRLQERGHGAIVKKGYRTPEILRGMSNDGKIIITINNINELKKVDAKTQKISIISSMGLRKRILIIEEAKKQKIEVANYKDADKYVNKKLEERKLKKEAKDSEKEKRSLKKAEAEKKKQKQKEEKKSVDEKVTEEEQKKEDKKEKDKVLIHKE